MKHLLVVICLASSFIFAGCSKSSPTTEPAWLEALKAESSGCVCLVGIRTGSYLNQTVYEFYTYDPLCNGVNIVYRRDGSSWFRSSDAIYSDYRENVKNEKVIWTCEKK